MSERARGRYDMPRPVKEEVARIANGMNISHSMIAAVLLADSLRRLRDGEISLDEVDKLPSDSPKYGWVIPYEEILKVLDGEREL